MLMKKIIDKNMCIMCLLFVVNLPCPLEESLRGTVRLLGTLSTKDLGTMFDSAIASGSLTSSWWLDR